MIPAAVLVVPQYLTVLDVPLVHRNLLNTPWAIWLPSVTNAFNIFLLKRFFDSIPTDLLDAAAIDGATPAADAVVGRAADVPADPRRGVDLRGGQRLEGLPLADAHRARPLETAHSTSASTRLSTGVTENELIAALTIASVPTLVIFLLFQRNIMSGLTAGSLKG